jgi:uncharacterized protein
MLRNAIATALLTVALAAGTAPLSVPPQTTASSQETAPDVWIAPSHPIPAGQAPNVKVQLLSVNGEQRTYAVIFGKGDEVLSGLTDFARQYQVTAAHFTAIGALSGAHLGWFNPEKKMYRQISIDTQVEVVSMLGDIALYKGNPVVHTHMVVGLRDGSTRAGHVLDAHVNPTLEVMVTVDPNAMHKRFDDTLGFTIIDPSVHE